MYSFWSSLRPVRRTSFAFTTTTKSPPSTCGVKVGLCLPRRIVATCEAKRPSTLSRASATNQCRTTSASEMLRVGFFGLGKAVLSEGGSARGMGYLNPGCGSTMIAHQMDPELDAGAIFTLPEAYADPESWHAVAARLRRETPVFRVEAADFDP